MLWNESLFLVYFHKVQIKRLVIMTVPLKKLREATLVALFSSKFSDASEDLLPLVMEQLKLSKKNTLSALERSRLVHERAEEFDVLIDKHTIGYEIERISPVEKAILRLAVFELLFDDDVPEKVAIAEAVRLARKFSTPESGGFVNGVLDSIYNSKGADLDADVTCETPRAHQEECLT